MHQNKEEEQKTKGSQDRKDGKGEIKSWSRDEMERVLYQPPPVSLHDNHLRASPPCETWVLESHHQSNTALRMPETAERGNSKLGHADDLRPQSQCIMCVSRVSQSAWTVATREAIRASSSEEG